MNSKKIMAVILAFSAFISVVPDAEALARKSSRDARGYLYGGRSPTYTNNVNRTRSNLDVVLVDYFEVNASGNAVMTHTPDRDFIRARQAEGHMVLAYVSNHWSYTAGAAAMANSYAVAAKLAGWVAEYGLDGVDVDIENLTSKEKTQFTGFCTQLRLLMPKDKHLSAAVAPNPWGISSGWQGQYDYAALGSVCDAILLMTYDESYQGGPPGPVASYDFTEKSIKEALKYIPKEKLYLGIPFYGRYWVSYASGGSDKGKAFTVSDVETIVNHYRSTTWYDAANHCARAKVTVNAADPGIALWGGKKLAAGTYDIFYENERSLRTRMDIIERYDLAGVGAWALGQEPERVWNSFAAWLRAQPFDDIVGYWAEPEITHLAELGIVNGTGLYVFEPRKGLTRAEACSMISKLLGLQPLAVSAGTPDEIRNHWGADMLWRYIQTGILRGDGTGYHPDRIMTRAELAELCLRVMNVPNTNDFNQDIFDDVRPGMWMNGAVVTCYLNGVMIGRDERLFAPGETCTRAEAAVVVRRLIDVEKNDLNQVATRRSMPKPDRVLEPR